MSSDVNYLPRTDIVNRKPTDEDIRVNHYGTLPHQTMYIMLDTSQHTDSTVDSSQFNRTRSNELTICSICVYSNGTLIIEPDFNAGKMAHIVETDTLNNEVFHFYLEHASINIQEDDLIKETKLFVEVCNRQRMYLAQLVGNQFESVCSTTIVYQYRITNDIDCVFSRHRMYFDCVFSVRLSVVKISTTTIYTFTIVWICLKVMNMDFVRLIVHL
jgi:hypothetical protein